MKIVAVPEYEMNTALVSAINGLFDVAFDGYPTDMCYYNQIPDFRLLVYENDALIGHAGIHHRHICIDKTHVLSVFGISDLCVHPDKQLHNVGSKLLEHISLKAVRANVDFIILTSGAETFYEKNGFFIVKNPCRWLVLRNHESIGVFRRELPAGLLVKQTGSADWPDGEVDFMGHMF